MPLHSWKTSDIHLNNFDLRVDGTTRVIIDFFVLNNY
jgi:hypothetical protein